MCCLDQVRYYVRNRLLKKLGLADCDFSVSVPQRGLRSLLFFLEIMPLSGPARSFVLRMIRHPFVAYNTVISSQHFRRKGIQIADLIIADVAPWVWTRHGSHFICESMVEGRHIDDLGFGRSAIEALAGALAKLHSVKRSRHGDLLFGRFDDIAQYHGARISRALRRLHDRLAAGEIEAIQRWFCRELGKIRGCARFSLLHGRMNMTNVLVDEDGGVFFIDTADARYGLAEWEMERAIHRFAADSGRRQTFLNAYFEQRDPGARDTYEERRALSDAAFHLVQASRWQRRGERRGSDPAADSEVIRNLEELRLIVSLPPSSL